MCRFGFPKAPSPSTLISRQPEDDINAQEILKSSKEILAKVHEALEGDQDITLEELLQKANVTEDQYIESLRVTQHGKNIILKCSPSDVFTNGSNHKVLNLWRANIAFQYVLDAYSTVMYVVRYMMKSEKAMGELLKQVAKECRNESIAV